MDIPRELFDVAPLWAIKDPAERLKAANALTIEVGRLSVALAEVTRGTVQEMRKKGMSLAQVAAVLGVSRGRVQQLEKSKPRS